MNPIFRCIIPLGVAVAFAFDPCAAEAAEKKNVVTSVVNASLDKKYRRRKNPDGSFKTEYYALSYGGQAKGTVSHPTIDQVPREEFERLVKEQLQKQNYQMAPDAASAGLLIHLLWGMTAPSANDTNLQLSHNNAAESLTALAATGANQVPGFKGGWGIPALTPEQREAEAEAEGALIAMILESRQRDRVLAPTASLLGYIDTVNDLADSPAIHAGLGTLYRDLREEIAERRYYVLVFAYDFKVLRQRNELKPLWVTRVSIQAKGNDFDEQIAAMVARAGQYFGRQTEGLVRRFEGHVEIGEAEVIGMFGDEPEKAEKPVDQPEEEPVDTGASEPTVTP